MTVKTIPGTHNQVIRCWTSITECRDIWALAAPADNLLLQVPYLEALETCPPDGMQFRYAVLEEGDEIIAIIYIQTLHFKGRESFRFHLQEEEGPPCLFDTLGKFIKGLVAKKVTFKTIVCGNLMISGKHGYAFKHTHLEDPETLDKVMLRLSRDLEHEGMVNSIAMVKDFEPEDGPDQAAMEALGYHHFYLQPNLVMDLDPDWMTYQDYLKALSSKYRVRANKARKLFASQLKKRTLTLEEVIQYNERIYQLYQKVVDDSGFNIINLHPLYFVQLKTMLGEDLIVNGYFEGNNLVAFSTAIVNHDELEAHFIGYEGDWNPKVKLYLNILLDFVETGIQYRTKRINYARTADEIKTSVGAVPVNMSCYMRHKNAFSNRFIGPLLDYLTPRELPVQRHPFKKGEMGEG